MSIVCNIAGHKWNGCKCLRCGVLRDREHEWRPVQGQCTEKCRICGHTRTVEHKWEPVLDKCEEKCNICGQVRKIDHTWNGCRCERCGEIRNESHKWESVAGKCEEKCVVCGQTRTIPHTFVNGICTICGYEEVNEIIAEIKNCSYRYPDQVSKLISQVNDKTKLFPLITNEDAWKCDLRKLEIIIEAIKNDPKASMMDLDDIWIKCIHVIGHDWRKVSLVAAQVSDKNRLYSLITDAEFRDYQSQVVIIKNIKDDMLLSEIANNTNLSYDLRTEARDRISDTNKKNSLKVERNKVEQYFYDLDIKSGM